MPGIREGHQEDYPFRELEGEECVDREQLGSDRERSLDENDL